MKTTYDARVKVPSPLVALMSAVSTGSEIGKGGENWYFFEQKVPMSCYLIALAVGDLESRDIGQRTRVWSEPSMVELGAHEFAETEEFLRTAEDICGSYVWGRYDLLLLPPSFPYGGMENPCLTFVTPTLLAGDRSLANVVAHEISHSWMGNLVTCASWEDFWLNEGWTVWVERKIIQAVYGQARAGLKTAIGYRHLEKAVESMGSTHAFTRLHIPMQGVDPDDSFSSVPYEKGFAFLAYLEGVVGEAAFAGFVKEYVKTFQFGVVSAVSFQALFQAAFPLVTEVDWHTWMHVSGLPIASPNSETGLIELSEFCAAQWVAVQKQPACAQGSDTSWSSDQLVVLLEKLLTYEIGEDLLSKLDAFYAFSTSRNAEIKFRWYTMCLRSELVGSSISKNLNKVDTKGRKGDTMEPTPQEDKNSKVQLDVVNFLVQQGRMKFVRPLYKDLYATNPELALATFNNNKHLYHGICVKMVSKDLGIE